MSSYSFDEVLNYSIDYEVCGCLYRVEIEIVTHSETDDELIHEVCDVMTVVRATSTTGETYDHHGWREILDKHGLEQDFWEESVEKYAYIQACLKTFEPGNA